MNTVLAPLRNQSLPSLTSSWLEIKSNVFCHGGLLPCLYRQDGLNVNPTLIIEALPQATRSVVVMLLDADAPIRARVHWICWDLPPTTQIQVNEKRGINGINDFSISSYVGPFGGPSSHKYYFIVYALDRLLCLPSTTSVYLVERMIQSYTLAWGTILFFSTSSHRSGRSL